MERLRGFDQFVRDRMADWQVPGVAVAVAKGGEIIHSEGYGLRNVAAGLPVTASTLFAIGSSTKAFTTMVLGTLVDAGKLDWDTPVRTYLPDFKLYDPWATERMTPRDLVTHRSGLPRHDLVWYNSSASREGLVARLRYLEPTYDFRSRWQYQNLMYLTAGYLAGKVGGCSWEELVRDRIFRRLGMSSSNFSVDQSQQAEDHSLPYLKKDDQAIAMPFRNISTVGPAGSINSNLTDMAQWLLLHLNRGKHHGEQVISAANLQQMHSPQMVIQRPQQFKELPTAAYGLGWFVEPYRGRYMVHHGGNIDGFSALVTFMPDENIGLVVLTNLNANPLASIIAYNVYDRLLGLDEIDWQQRIREEHDRMQTAGAQKEAKSAADRVSGTQPSHALSAYVGQYVHPGYGTLTVDLTPGGLTATYNGITMPLTHYHYDIFEGRVELLDMTMLASFGTDLKGNVDSVSLPLEPALKPLVLTRLPERPVGGADALVRLAGEYAVTEAITASVAVRGDTLTLTIPGQPTLELEAYKGNTFNVKGLPVSVDFRCDESGAATEISINQPGAVFVAKRK